MAAKDFTTPIEDIGEAVNRIFRIAAIAQGANALLASNESRISAEMMSAIFMLERIEGDLLQLAGHLDAFDLNQSRVTAQPA